MGQSILVLCLIEQPHKLTFLGSSNRDRLAKVMLLQLTQAKRNLMSSTLKPTHFPDSAQPGQGCQAAVKVPKRIMKWAGSLVFLLKGGLAVFAQQTSVNTLLLLPQSQQSFVLQKPLAAVLRVHVLCVSVYQFGAQTVLRGQHPLKGIKK